MFDKKKIEETDYMHSCAQTDCTGLIPALPQNEEEIEAYEELYPFLSPEIIPHSEADHHW